MTPYERVRKAVEDAHHATRAYELDTYLTVVAQCAYDAMNPRGEITLDDLTVEQNPGGTAEQIGTMTPLICCDERHQQKIEALKAQLRLEQEKRRHREEQLDKLSASHVRQNQSFVDIRALEEARKEARYLREKCDQQAKRLDVAIKALAGFGLVFEQ